HTRSDRDWSSDVCSSDLNPSLGLGAEQFTPGGPKAGGDALAQAQYTVILNQIIELGGKRDRRIDSARAATRVTGYELEDVRRQEIGRASCRERVGVGVGG